MTDAIETTTDAFLGGALMLRQLKRGYRAGIDPVLLAASCAADAGERVLDCGAGVGTVGLAIARRVEGCDVVLIERDPVYARLAEANIVANRLSHRVRLVEADITVRHDDAVRALAGTFDRVLANPPYYVDTDGTRSSDRIKDAANTMPAADFELWVRFLATMARTGATVSMIHRADALGRIFAAFEHRFGGLQVTPLQASPTTAAGRVLVSAIKGSRAPSSLRPAIVLHQDGGGYTPDVDAVLRAPLRLTATTTTPKAVP